MSQPIESLLGALDLQSNGARTGEDIFIGASHWMPNGRVFGGQVLAQSLVAAIRTTPDDRVVHSTHGYFLRPGDVDLPITFAVDRIHDGRSFSTRRAQAYQNGLPILSMIASFQRPDAGLDHQQDMPAGIPQPEDLPSTADLVGDGTPTAARDWLLRRPFDIRYSPEPIVQTVGGVSTSLYPVWMKSITPLPDDDNLHRAALAYSSDYTLLQIVLQHHRVPWTTRGIKSASLDHALWIHRQPRMDEWMLFLQQTPSATGGRGLSHGSFYTPDGVLIATAAQESMIRMPADPPAG